MLKLAKLYEEDLNLKFINCINNPHFKYLMGSWSEYKIELGTNNWDYFQYVSVDRNDNIIGYLEGRVDRTANYVWGLEFVNFTQNTNLTFSKDCKAFFDLIFETYKFNKVNWCVFVGNPAEEIYDKFIERYKGRIVGVYKDDFYTYDRELCDKKAYELMRRDYLNSKNKIRVI
ncbi:MAG: hypothetical protein E6182_18810 [Clostridioides difficile]|nr:hypothetical protein [Clostridioides difficile]